MVWKINVEPCIFLYRVYLGIFLAVSPSFLYFKECIEVVNKKEHPAPVHFCQALDRGEETVDLATREYVDHKTAYLIEWTTLASAIPSCFTALIFGYWSDRNGRKFPLIVTLAGTVFSSLIFIQSAEYGRSFKPFWLIIASAIRGVTGGPLVMFQMATAAVRDVYPDKKAFAVYLSVVMGLSSVGQVVGSLAGAYMVDYVGYRWVFLLGLSCVATAFLYVIFVMEETLVTANERYPTVYQGSGSSEYDSENSSVCCRIVGSLLHVVFGERTGNKRKYLIVSLSAFLIMVICDQGLTNILILFVKLPPFFWCPRQFSIYTAFCNALIAIGVPIATVIIVRWLKWHEIALVNVGLITNAAKFAAIGFAKSEFQLFAVSSLSLLSFLEYSGFRSHFALLVSENETGKLFAIFAVLDTIGPMLASVAFNNVYPLTIGWFPGLLFVIGGGILLLDTIPMFAIQIEECIRKRRQASQTPPFDESDERTKLLSSLNLSYG